MDYGRVPETQSYPSPTGPPAICCLADPKKKSLPEDLALLGFPGVLAGSPLLLGKREPLLHLHQP